MKKITVVIVTYNSEQHIYDCLESVFNNNDIGDELEVVVVDNCSKDFDKMLNQIQLKYGNKVVVIQNTKNGGYGQGNNVGIKAASSSIIMIMNPDVRLCGPVFGKVYEIMNSDKDIVAYGLTQKNSEGKNGRSISWTKRVHPYIAEPMRFIFERLNIYWSKFMYVDGACFFLQKEAFIKAGMYDEGIFMYNEEDDIHHRLLKLNGVKIKYDRHLCYIHLHKTVTDYAHENHNWLKKSMESLLYMSERDGISKEKTINWAIKRANTSIWSERIKIFLGKGNKDRMKYFEDWKCYLVENYK